MQEQPSTTKQKGTPAKFFKKHAARIAAVQILYSIENDQDHATTTDSKIYDILEVYQNELSKSKISKADHAHLVRLVRFTKDNMDDINAKISPLLGKDWRLERLPKMVLYVLQTAVGELYLDKDIDAKIVINEYLEIAKIFNHEGEAGFINSLLDKIAQQR